MNTTIAAISTPQAAGGIAVIRISGPDALTVAEQVFQPVSGKPIADMKGYTCAYGSISNPQTHEILDHGILTVFRAPNSYTGEMVAEISCHGGIFISREILRVILQSGAVPAQPGEFTQRAFRNGKLSLTQAEAVMDLISADNARELAFARSVQDGALFRRIHGIIDQLIAVLGALAAWADYPEDDIPEVQPEALLASITAIEQQLKETLATSDYGRILRSGVSAVIVGKPNVGKSTLFNLLSGCQRSIVTSIAGTTRDVIEEKICLGDVTLRLSDTAGLRDTEDVIEQMGVDIAKECLRRADLVLAVFDASQPLEESDTALLEQLRDRTVIGILNKTDCPAQLSTEQLKAYIPCWIAMSAKEGSGLEALREAIEERFYTGQVSPELGILANERQTQCVQLACESVTAAAEALVNGEFLDAITVLLDDAAQHLLTLTGESVSEKVVEDVFSRFCVGK